MAKPLRCWSVSSGYGDALPGAEAEQIVKIQEIQGVSMGVLEKLFNRLREKQTGAAPTPEGCQILDFQNRMQALFGKNTYLSRREYLPALEEFAAMHERISLMRECGMLQEYCAKNGVQEEEALRAEALYEGIEGKADAHNEEYISREMEAEKEYLDHILAEVDPAIRLDDDQRRVVLTDEDYCLVIAGAGAGKTTTVAAKVKYLTEKKRVDPKQILVVSFTNKAVEELKEKINRDLKIDCPVTTFHAAGNSILRRQSSEPLQVADPGKLYYVIQDFFRDSLLENDSLVSSLILFFGSYFDAPYEGKDLETFFRKAARTNLSTLRSDLEEISQTILDRRTGKKVTISNEIVRSLEEAEIANFLYLHQIDYEYEPLYKYNIPGARKPYTPDFLISQNGKTAYLEHFGITEAGENSRYSPEQLRIYKQAIADKTALHKKHGTRLICTYSQYRDGRPLREHLAEALAENGFAMEPRPAREVMEKLVSTEENRYIRKLVNLICRFISNFKVNGYGIDAFDRMYYSTRNERSRLFLNICRSCYLEYQRYLMDSHLVDFEDMINESARILREMHAKGERLDFRYIIVDEYQDISRQRFDLTTALAEVCDAKIIAVGDDWQSIYAFSGSDVELFTKFQEKMGYGKLLKIVKTYRNSQEVIDIAGGFIQKNPSQIRKTLESPKHIQDPVIIYTYDGSRKKPKDDQQKGALFQLAKAVETALEQIRIYAAKEREGKMGSVLLLGRFGFDGDQLERSGLFRYIRRGNKLRWMKHPEADITFMTAHASKGLGYDNVIIINGKNETYGFPSKVEDDPVLAFVIKGDRSIDYAEERRLFYVAMTRTKNRVYLIAPQQNPSEFLLEIKRDYKNVSLKGAWNEEAPPDNGPQNRCPVCGYPLQLRYRKSYGLRMYICTNEPEICGFLSNDLRGGRMSILKCDQCTDGYLIVKGNRTKGGTAFLGCTNYRADGTGCMNTMSWKKYAALFEPGSAGAETSQTASGESAYPQHSTGTDLCPGDEEADPEQQLRQSILDCVEHVSRIRCFGVTVMVDILLGAENEKIQRYKLFHVPEYGALKGMERKKLRDTMERMIEEGKLRKTEGEYPVLEAVKGSAIEPSH